MLSFSLEDFLVYKFFSVRRNIMGTKKFLNLLKNVLKNILKKNVLKNVLKKNVLRLTKTNVIYI